ncbi:hypothetical protein R6Q59_023659 [Mikania micrantha]
MWGFYVVILGSDSGGVSGTKRPGKDIEVVDNFSGQERNWVMTTIQEKLNSTGVNSGAHNLLEEMKLLKEMQDHSEPLNNSRESEHHSALLFGHEPLVAKEVPGLASPLGFHRHVSVFFNAHNKVPAPCQLLDLPFLGPDLHKQLTSMAHTYGPIFKLRLGSKLHVVINTPELAKAVARDQDQTFANRNLSVAASVITYGGQDIVWSNNNSHWRKLRKIFVHGALSNKNLEACSSFRSDEVRKTIKNVFGRIGTTVDINQISFLTESNVLTSMILGNTSPEGSLHLGSELQTVAQNINEIFGRPNLSDFFPSLAWLDLQGVKCK